MIGALHYHQSPQPIGLEPQEVLSFNSKQAGATMRSFRFRVWDHESSTMIPPSAARLGFAFFGEDSEPHAFLFDAKKDAWKQIPLTHVLEAEYAHDRSGKEIFTDGTIDTPRGRRLVRWRAETFAAMNREAMPKWRAPANVAMRIVMVGRYGPEGEELVTRLHNGTAMAEAWSAAKQGGHSAGASSVF